MHRWVNGVVIAALVLDAQEMPPKEAEHTHSDPQPPEQEINLITMASTTSPVVQDWNLRDAMSGRTE